MPEIVITEFMHKQAVAALSREFEVHYDPTLGLDPEGLRRIIRKVRGLIVRERTDVDIPLIADALALRVVGQIGTPADNVDRLACEGRGIEVIRAPETVADSVAEYVLAAALLLMRGAFLSTTAVIAGQWPRGHLVGREIAGKRLGLLGLDLGARAAALRARALGLTVAGWDPFLKETSPVWRDLARSEFDALIAGSDVLSVHLPAHAKTHGLLGPAALMRMKAGSVLIAVGGAGVVDEAALANMLSTGRLRGAAIDGFETEPLTGEAGKVFARVPNLILSPRVADLTVESHLRSSQAIADKMAAALRR
ncbi:NAD(P)-dependent oxidoreductase [Prosthecomicrobium pneumaticum]|uniref:(S)-sulfolactate dehydrogenase n=1 Tax=Prosthecomicrobium pneumaticum TaxID=81895 RepID=A0A7W9CUY1_9HYPH|nr:(S)-sulfolactate dehydrogenase [Prosthecomicrobium pneumaticum]